MIRDGEDRLRYMLYTWISPRRLCYIFLYCSIYSCVIFVLVLPEIIDRVEELLGLRRRDLQHGAAGRRLVKGSRTGDPYAAVLVRTGVGQEAGGWFRGCFRLCCVDRDKEGRLGGGGGCYAEGAGGEAQGSAAVEGARF